MNAWRRAAERRLREIALDLALPGESAFIVVEAAVRNLSVSNPRRADLLRLLDGVRRDLGMR